MAPRPPRPWGPKSPVSTLGPAVGLAAPVYPIVEPYVPSRFTWENGGSINATWDLGDLRPRDVADVEPDEAFVVLVRDPSINVVRGSWTLTAKGHHDVYEGELELPVADDAGIDDAVAEFLQRISG